MTLIESFSIHEYSDKKDDTHQASSLAAALAKEVEVNQADTRHHQPPKNANQSAK